MKTCQTNNEYGMEFPSLIQYYVTAIISCLEDVKLPPKYNAYTLLGSGSYGSVWGVKGHVKGRKKNLAIKIITFNDNNAVLKHESRAEVDYAERMAKAGIGPRIYESVYLKAPRGMRAVIIIMQQGRQDGYQYLYSPTRSLASKKKMLREMMMLVHKMVSMGMYCYDIKPGNFVVTSHRKPQIIDFGGQFCSNQRYKAMVNMRSQAQHLAAGGGEDADIWHALATMQDEHYNDFLDNVFFTLIVIPFISLIAEMDKESSSLLGVFKPFAERVCLDLKLLVGCTIVLENDNNIWTTFAHYLRHTGSTRNFRKVSATARRQFFKESVERMCMEIAAIPEQNREKGKSRRSTRRRKSRRSTRRRRKSRRSGGRRKKRGGHGSYIGTTRIRSFSPSRQSPIVPDTCSMEWTWAWRGEVANNWRFYD